MSVLEHERPGVYSTYDASAVVSAGQATKVIGVAAKAVKGTEKEPVTVTGYTAGVEAFGEDAETPGMSTILRLLFANGASTVVAVRVAENGELADYQAAFAALADQDVQILVCDSADVTVQQALRTAGEEASASRRERIAVVGGNGESAEELVERAAQLNSERMVLVGPDALDSAGETISGVFMAAAVAGVIASNRDPAVPLNGAEVKGLGGVAQTYSDNEVDLLVRGGVTPMESVAGVLSPIRGITTRTTTGEAADTTWRELTTILIVDDLIPSVRNSLRSKFTRTKNTANILMKNFVDFMFGSLLYWLVGFGIMFGLGDFFGTPHLMSLLFDSNGLPDPASLPTEGFLVFQTVFCATSATIVSGAMAERTKFSMYLVYTIFISVLIYPVSGHWTWGGGWLMNGEAGSFMTETFGTTFHDFAGSTIVHSVGGWIALVGAAILGPRIGKYGKDGRSKAIPGHNLTIAALGVFILWFG